MMYVESAVYDEKVRKWWELCTGNNSETGAKSTDLKTYVVVLSLQKCITQSSNNCLKVGFCLM
jgi:hypothetical protein